MQVRREALSERWHVLRHARPLVGQGVCYGRHDIPADAAATQAAAQDFAQYWLGVNGGDVAGAGESCKSAGGLRVQVLCSPLQRCQQLAQALLPLLANAGVAVQWQAEAALAEMDFGRWEGQPWAALPADEWKRWMDDFAGYRVGGGESTRALLQRVHGAAQASAALLAANAQNRIIWVSHAGVMCALHWLQSQTQPLHQLADWLGDKEFVPVPQTASDWPQHAACAFGQWQVVNGYAHKPMADKT